MKKKHTKTKIKPVEQRSTDSDPPTGHGAAHKLRDWAAQAYGMMARSPYLAAVLAGLAYLLIFQWPFVSSGDIWAEAYYEYVHGAVVNGWQGFFHTGIAGYFNFLPKLISYPFIILGLPLDKIDVFFRIATVIFAVICVAYIAHRHNRYLIRNDAVRISLAIAVLMSLYHVSSFSMINVWYVGFIPIILVSLNPARLRNQLQEVLYAAFAMSVCLTKPSLILLPLILYRMIRHKELLLGFIIGFAIALETLLFFTSSYYDQLTEPVHVDIFTKLLNTMTYNGLLGLKLLQLEPTRYVAIIAATAFYIGLLVIFIRKLGALRGILIGLTLTLASYTAIYSPDAGSISVRSAYSDLFHDQMKLQRELISYFILLVLGFTALSTLGTWHRLSSKRFVAPTLTVLVATTTLFMLYRPIDTTSSGIFIDLSAFKSSLASNKPSCMPIPPTSSWKPIGYPDQIPVYNWVYENGALGMCDKANYDKAIDYSSFDKPLKNGLSIVLQPNDGYEVNALLIPIVDKNPTSAQTVTLSNVQTGRSYKAEIIAKSDHLSFVAFNLDDEAPQERYEFILSSQGDELYTGAFYGGGDAYYAYFLEAASR